MTTMPASAMPEWSRHSPEMEQLCADGSLTAVRRTYPLRGMMLAMIGAATLPLAVILCLLAIDAFQGGVPAIPGLGYRVLLAAVMLGLPCLASALLLDRWIRDGLIDLATPASGGTRRVGVMEFEAAARQCATADADRAAADAMLESRNQDIAVLLGKMASLQDAAQVRSAHAQRLEALGTLAGSIAHDFGNVLQVIEGGIDEILERPGDTATVDPAARLMQDVIGTAREAVRRLLTLARQEDDHCAADCDVAPALNRVHEMLRRAMPKTVALEFDVPAGLPPMQADASRLEAALLNLASNAQHAMPQGGTLRVVARSEKVRAGSTAAKGLRSGPYIRIDVTDTGLGMSAATLARASEPFFTTRPAGQGTGLGLSATRGFAEQFGGGIAIASTPEQGTTVSIWLPSRTKDAATATDAPDTSLRIILLDDDSMIRDVISRQLRKRGLRVEVCANAAQTMAALEGPEAVDLLLTDFSMPDVSCDRLITRVHQRRPDLPVIILTGFPMDAAAVLERYTGSGLLSLLCKPAAAGDIDAEIRKIVQRLAPHRLPAAPPALA